MNWKSIPSDYFQWVRQAQQDLNNEVLSWREKQGREPPHISVVGNNRRKQRRLDYIRMEAEGARKAGFDSGIACEDESVEIVEGINRFLPYPRGTGAAENWLRGYMQARSCRSVLDYIKYEVLVK